MSHLCFIFRFNHSGGMGHYGGQRGGGRGNRGGYGGGMMYGGGYGDDYFTGDYMGYGFDDYEDPYYGYPPMRGSYGRGQGMMRGGRG